MGNIYSRAVITIIAAAGEDASYGLPGMGSVPRKGQAQETFHSVSFIEGNPRPHESVKASKWGKRGWTLQEGFLSPRRLIFTDYEAHFLCNEMLFSESWKYNLPANENWLMQNNQHFEGIIPVAYEPKSAACQLVEEFSQRAFSYDSDALNGFTGIMKALEMPGELTFLWGTPIYQTGLYLDWSHDVPSARRIEFPSWSPLGWKGPLKAWRYPVSWQSSGIRAGNGSEIQFHKLEVIPNSVSLSTETPRYLHWTEKIVNVRLIKDRSGRTMVEARQLSGIYGRLNVGVRMDGPSNGGDHFLLIPSLKSDVSGDDYCWLLEHQGAFWERIGVVRVRSPSNIYDLSAWEESHGPLDWKEKEIIVR